MQIECSVIRYWLQLRRFELRPAGSAPWATGRVEEIRAAGHLAVEAAAREHVDQLLAAAARISRAPGGESTRRPAPRAAAFWMAMNWPESLLSFTSANARTIRSWPQTQPSRQPIM